MSSEERAALEGSAETLREARASLAVTG